jgi:molybdate transport system substrate-binding protein
MGRPVLLLVSMALAGCARNDAPRPVQVAAASDLVRAFEAAAADFAARGGAAVRFSFGSSGLLAKQLREGAPFDLFAAADARFVSDAVESGACDGSTRTPYGRGRVVLWTKRGRVEAPASLEALRAPRFTRIALANPEVAPYGRAAKEALARAGLWDELAPRFVYAESVRHALQFAETGNVDAAFVARALVIDDQAGVSLEVDPASHAPLEQELVVCRRGPNRAGAEAFARYLASPEGRAVMRRHGFELPGEVRP